MATDDAAGRAPTNIRIGVLALQGSFREHMFLLQRIPGVEVVEVRTRDELESVAGLIIPGGESTTMALVAERWGLIPELQAFAKAGKPVWGTCAGMIFLAESAEGKHYTYLSFSYLKMAGVPGTCIVQSYARGFSAYQGKPTPPTVGCTLP
ncbi:hypothetical protein Vafri_852 [Volvox africanus]|nr:hypothetical protein Vafri_852 [Volvox africanus]